MKSFSFKATALLGLLAFVLVGCTTAEKATPSSIPPEQMKAEKMQAKKTIMALAGNLKGAMQTAMKAGGPTAAIETCNVQAMPLTDQVSKEFGVTISRTSLKTRNPNNAPSAWEKATLIEFDARLAKGEKPMEIAKAEVVMIGGKKVFRLMKAIPTAKVCLNCHGDKLKPAVAKSIADLYPKDMATGYSEGQIRGAFTYQKAL